MIRALPHGTRKVTVGKSLASIHWRNARDMVNPSDSTRSECARDAFARALERLDRGQPIDFEGLFRERPEIEIELRSLHASWRDLERVFEGLAADAAGFDQLARHTHALEEAARIDLDRLANPERASSRYERIERIAQGGMGVVWRAYDHDMQRELALKSMRLSDDGRLVRRFLSEARLAGRLDHPGILPVHDIGVDRSGELYFTMPLVRGTNLDFVLEQVQRADGGWTLVRVIEVLLRVCDAMDCAHAAGVIHRDLKPANIMVGRFGETYVMDWGLARAGLAEVADGERVEVSSSTCAASGETAHGAVLGTPAYMAPEQAQGHDVGPRADVYALGAILYHLLAGRPPYARRDEAQCGDDVLHALRAGPPDPIEDLAPHAVPELAAICVKAMARRVDDRYSGVRAMSDDLRAFVEGRVVRAHEIGAWPELKKWFRRNRRLALALAASLGIAIGGLAWVTYVETTSKAEILRLSDVRRLAELERRATELWPAVPEKIPALEHWLAEASALAANRTVHEDALREIGPAPVAQTFPSAGGTAGAAETSGARDAAGAGEAWRRDVLSKLVADLEVFAGAGRERSTIASVERRLDFARRIGPASLDEHEGEWRAAIASIADVRECPQYQGLAIRPQLGLVPIGRDSSSGLWEFAHLASGVPPARAANGSLALSPTASLVFVLLPGGSFAMGSLRPTPGQPSSSRTDPLAHEDETPIRTVELEPFFVSKYEMTAAQWQRLAEAGQRSAADGVSVDLLYPAAAISWADAQRELAHVALTLPTEAQWEYAARAGSATRWWFGNDARALVAAANAGSGIDASLPYDDDFAHVAPVDALLPNAFGLHHVHGNLREWTLDAYAPSQASTFRSGDGLAATADRGLRSARGGGFASSIAAARSAARAGVPLENRDPEIGIRPARALER